MAQLALHGGPKVKRKPFGTGRRFGLEEIKELAEALEQNTLFYTKGKKVQQFCEAFAARYGVRHCIATTSGTASIHVALGAAGVGVGDEVITSPITDQGTLIGILYQNAVPKFADLDLDTYNLTAEYIEAQITPRTKAILVVHLAGNPCDMAPIMDLARQHGLAVIEDCAQSYLCEYRGQLAGTIGDLGAFSLNDFKHISAGDAGMVITDDDELADRCALYADKAYDRTGQMRHVHFLAPNYRMCELHGAVALAQLKKLDWICQRRHEIGDYLTARVSDLPGIHPPKVLEGCKSTYWFWMMRLDEEVLGVSRQEYVQALNAEGIPASAGYISEPVYNVPLFTRKNAYPNFPCPFECPVYRERGGEVEYGLGLCPNAEEILRTCVRLPCSEFWTDEDVEELITAIRKVTEYYWERK